MSTAVEETASERRPRFDVERVRRDFPALFLTVHGKPLAYLDNAATAHKPGTVIEAEARFYREANANVHRGVHALSLKATIAYEEAREKAAGFLGAESLSEIVFVRGATEAINLVAATHGRQRVGAGDEIVVTAMEHHSNIVPWQLLCEEKGARLKVAPIDDAGQLVAGGLEELLTDRTRIVALVHVSNALGTVNPVRELTAAAHEAGATVVVDGAQAAPHMPVDVAELGCDFYAVSGHKAFGPTGIGLLWGRADLLREMPPYQGGGEMIRSVSFERSEYADPPARFEAGTPNIAGAVGLGAALDYLGALDWAGVAEHEEALLAHATEALEQLPGLSIIGRAERKAAVVSFVLDGVHAHDVGTIVDREGVAVRTGHHCAQPVMERFGVPATTRASFAFYNSHEEVDRLVAALAKVREVFA
ncbi:MAG: cysteine desulfurase [Thermoanaerobaculia bacterium]|nr:cysteine desulfurase [Thermoanaerobaculia bacterium]